MARLPYVLPDQIDDAELRGWLEEAIAAGKPGPEIQSVRAHVPGVMRSFTMTRQWIFHEGVLDHELKELLRGYIAASAGCLYCANQSTSRAWMEDRAQLDQILSYKTSGAFDDRQTAALEYADAIMWDPGSVDDDLWQRLLTHFSVPEIVELGYWVGFTFGGQRWLKTLEATQGELAAAIAEAESAGVTAV